MTSGIVVNDVSKKYKSSGSFAVRNLNLDIAKGEVYGLLGPNGAGKTTTIRMLMGFISPTTGSCSILGADISNKSVAIRRKIGYLPSDMTYYAKMTGKNFLDYMSELLPADKEYLEELTTKFKVDLEKRIDELSRGNRQKIAILQALMHKPEVIILDEPTSGLDPLMQEIFYEEIIGLKNRGSSILLSSHIFGEVQKICDRLGIIKDGELITERNVSDILAESVHKYNVIFESKVPADKLRKLSGVKDLVVAKNRAEFSYRGDLPKLLNLLADNKVSKLQTSEADLEEIFLGYYESEAEK